ncbi:hypothetical protein BS47DRAFT_1384115 [Hydnum rufescens UP504]|uniref:Uncharacterized protein n=1 Tax=Hydnum rufescens UP504 TaxID=1448309 RepID=A0A9P6ARB0_9AGAM|nr:hypothetical protein BS47DRAFT_1384115 [Hydnum rufescens UP504]
MRWSALYCLCGEFLLQTSPASAASMSSTKFWSLRRASLPSSLPVLRHLPRLLRMSLLPLRLHFTLAYPDYFNGHPDWDAALTLASILDVVPALPPALADSLTRVLDVVSGIIDAVKPVRDRRDAFEHLIFGVLKFLQFLVDELQKTKGSNFDDTSTTASLIALRLYVSFNPCISST